MGCDDPGVVARGEAELGFQQISELLPVPGIDYVEPLPPEIQRVNVFSAGVAVGADQEVVGKVAGGELNSLTIDIHDGLVRIAVHRDSHVMPSCIVYCVVDGTRLVDGTNLRPRFQQHDPIVSCPRVQPERESAAGCRLGRDDGLHV